MADSTQPVPAGWYAVYPGGKWDDLKGVPGMYRRLASGGAEIEVHRTFSDNIAMREMLDSETPAILYGDAFGTPVTAVGCRQVKNRASLGSLQQLVLRPRWCFEGIFLEAEELSVSRVQVSFRDQDVWAQWGAYEASMTEQWSLTAVEYTPPDPIVVEVDDAKLTLKDSSVWKQTSTPSGWVVESHSVFEISFPQPLSLDDLAQHWLLPLRFLISSATGRETSVTSLWVRNDAWVLEDGRQLLDWYKVRVDSPDHDDPSLESFDLLHRLSDLEAGTHLPAAIRQYRSQRYAADFYLPAKLPSRLGYVPRFVAACQMTEAFDRFNHPETPPPNRYRDAIIAAVVAEGGSRNLAKKIAGAAKYAHGRSLEDRLRRLDFEAGGFVTEMVGHRRWAQHVAAVRNLAVHGLERSVVLPYDVRGIQVALQLLVHLFEARWLSGIGMDSTLAHALVENRHRFWTSRNLVTDGYGHLEALAAKDVS